MIVNLVEYLETTGQQLPDELAVLAGDRQMTFAEWRMASRQLGVRILQRAPTQANRPIVVVLPKGVDALVAFLGVLYSGHFYVPLDGSSPASRLEKIFADLQPMCVVTAVPFVERLTAAGCDPSQLLLIDEACAVGPDDEQALTEGYRSTIDTDPCYIKYTSGSTGDPKGVVLPHRAVVDYIECAQDMYHLNQDDVIANQAPFTFDVSVQDIYLSLKSGATLLLVPEQHFVFPANLITLLTEQRVTFFCWVPSVLVNVCNLDLLRDVETSLRWVTVLGEVMPTKPFKYWAEHCPQATLVNTYGPTEAAVASTYYVWQRPIDDGQPIPIGHPYRNTSIFLLDENEQLAGPGAVGEICIRGSSLALGYWNADESTRNAFTGNPGQTHYPETVYRTGDLGHFNEFGELMFVGRRDTQIKHQGYRIELGEIEVAAAAVAGVQQACVVYDHQRRQIVLFYSAASELNAAEWRKTLAESLPAYMLPKAFHRLDEFPLSAHGKVNRKRLMAELDSV